MRTIQSREFMRHGENILPIYKKWCKILPLLLCVQHQQWGSLDGSQTVCLSCRTTENRNKDQIE